MNRSKLQAARAASCWRMDVILHHCDVHYTDITTSDMCDVTQRGEGAGEAAGERAGGHGTQEWGLHG